MEMNTSTLQSTRVLVTGGTSGLGQAMAAALAGAGAHVALTGRDGARAEAAAGAMGASGIAMDVRDERSVEEGVAEAYERLGGLDVLVSNAGIGMRTVNPHFMTHPTGFWEVYAPGLSRRHRHQGQRLVPGGARGDAADARRRGRADRDHLHERADDDPPRVRSLRAVGCRGGGTGASDGGRPRGNGADREHPPPRGRHRDGHARRRGVGGGTSPVARPRDHGAAHRVGCAPPRPPTSTTSALSPPSSIPEWVSTGELATGCGRLFERREGPAEHIRLDWLKPTSSGSR